MTERLDAIEVDLHQTKAEVGQDILNFPPKLDNQWLSLLGTVESADARPTNGTLELYDDLRAELDTQLAKLQAVFDDELARFNDAVRSRTSDAVIVAE